MIFPITIFLGKLPSKYKLWLCIEFVLNIYYKWPPFAWWLRKYFTWCFRKVSFISCNFFYIVADHSVFSKILNAVYRALLRKFLKIQILAAKGFKLSACLWLYSAKELLQCWPLCWLMIIIRQLISTKITYKID